MKLEPQDDGYETSADLLLPNTANPHLDIKCEKVEDPYSFIDDDPMSMVPVQQPPPPYLPQPPAGTNQFVMGPKKRGRKKKIKTEE